MIKINIEKDNCRVEHMGDPVMVAAEVAAASGAVYNAYKTRNTLAAEIFRVALIKSLMPDSPAWDPDRSTTVVISADKKSGGAPTGQS